MKRNFHEKGKPSYHLVAFMWAHEKEIVQNLQQPPEGTFHIMYRKKSRKQSYVQGLSEMPKAKSAQNINTRASDNHD